MIELDNRIELRSENGKLWGTLQISGGRMLLECRKGGDCATFDLLETVRRRRAAVDIVRINRRNPEESAKIID